MRVGLFWKIKIKHKFKLPIDANKNKPKSQYCIHRDIAGVQRSSLCELYLIVTGTVFSYNKQLNSVRR